MSNGAYGTQSARDYTKLTVNSLNRKVSDSIFLTLSERNKIAIAMAQVGINDLRGSGISINAGSDTNLFSGIGNFFSARWNNVVGLFTEAKSTIAPLFHPKELLSGLIGALKLASDAQSAQTSAEIALNLRVGNSLLGEDDNSSDLIALYESRAEREGKLFALEAKLLWQGIKESYPECTNANQDTDDENLNQCIGRVAFNFIPFGAFTKVMKLEKLGVLVRSFAAFENVEDLTRVLAITDESLTALKLAGKSEMEAMRVLSETLGKIPKGATESEIVEAIQKISLTKSTILPNIIIDDYRFQHVIEGHTVSGTDIIGNSIFNQGEDIVSLIHSSESIIPVKQAGGNFERIVNAGRTIGFDRATGQPTSFYTIITNSTNELITAFPGKP